MEHGADRRKFERSAIQAPTRFIINDELEATGQLSDISKGGLFMLTDAPAEEGDKVVVYPEGLGRLEGRVVRRRADGVAVQFAMSDTYRELLHRRIAAALEGKPYLRIADRRSCRRTVLNIDVAVEIVGTGQSIQCRIDNISNSGAAIQSQNRPPVGANVRLGTMDGKVLRHTEEGFIVRFRQLQAA